MEASLRAIFMNPHITKIMHGSDTDIRYLVADLNMPTIGLFDTARAFTFLRRLSPKKDMEISGSV